MMKALISTLSLAAASAGLLLSTPLQAERPADRAAENRMKKMDSDGDGMVSLAEFTTWRTAWVKEKGKDEKTLRPKAIERAFGKLDADSNGQVTKAEMLAKLKSQRAD